MLHQKVLFLTILLSCIAYIYAQTEEEEMVRINEEYWERIEKPLSSISENYNLLLSAMIDDCGEFGGHLETIEILKVNSDLSAIISIHDQNCNGEWNLKAEEITSSNTYEISEEDLLVIETYLSKLLKLSLKEDPSRHARSFYEADLQERTDTRFKSQRLYLRYHDTSRKWAAFEELKEKLIK